MSDAPRWPGADGSPGLDFSVDRGARGTASIYRDDASRSPDSPSDTDATSSESPSRALSEPAEESTKVAGPRFGSPSAVEWATRPLGTPVPAPSTPVVGGAASGVAGASAASVTAPVSAASAAQPVVPAPRAPRVGSRRTRKARLRLARIDPWSVMKTTFLFSIAFGVMLIVIVSVLWSVIAGSGALDSVNQFMTTLIGDQTGREFRVEDYISGSRILGFAALLAAIDVVIITAVSTLFAFLYNLAATIMGGLEVTLAED